MNGPIPRSASTPGMPAEPKRASGAAFDWVAGRFAHAARMAVNADGIRLFSHNQDIGEPE